MAGTDFSHLTDDELINGIKALNIPDYIRSKSYGIDVRETLAQMTEMLMQLALNQGMSPQEAQDFMARFNNKINKGEVSMSDLTQEVKEALTGGAVAVVGKDAVGTENIKDNAVKVSKTSYIKTIGKNLFNKNAIKTETNGNVSSELLKIEANTTYYTNLPAKFNVYTKEGTLATAGLDNLNIGATFENPYYKIVFDPQYIENMMLVKIPYVPNRTEYPEIEYEPYTGGEEVYAFDKKIKIALSDVEGVNHYKGLNLFDKNKAYTDDMGRIVSDFLNIEANTIFHTNNPATFYVYKEDKSLARVVGSQLNIAETFTNPYFRIVFEPQYLEDMMLVKSPYVASGNVLTPKYEPYTGGEEVYGFDKKLLVDIENSNGNEIVVDNEPYELYLPDFSGSDEPWHPSVIYIKDGFAGYKYWLVQSVYPNNPDLNEQKDRYEVPVVYKSNDGINWIVVANPLDDLKEAEIDNKDYMSDPHVVYNDDLKQLEVWYRLSHVVGSTLPTTIFRKITKDGETWSEREVTVPETLHTAPDFARSPSFVYDQGIYKMWKTNNEGIYYQESTDAKTWTTQTPVVAPGSSDGAVRSRWHIDVAKYQADGGQYHLVVYDMDALTIKHYSSEDGITFTFKSTVLKTVNGQSDLHNTRLYKSASMLDELGNVRLYFSGTGTRHTFANGEYKANVGVYIAPTWDELLNLDAVDYEKLKQSLNDLQFKALGMEITKSQYKVDDHSRI